MAGESDDFQSRFDGPQLIEIIMGFWTRKFFSKAPARRRGFSEFGCAELLLNTALGNRR